MEEFPASLKKALAEADEAYLAGLSNKGTVNRGKKDLQGLSPALTVQGEEAQVALGGETCTLRAPLGDSACTCPARGICRHLISAILWAKDQLGEAASQEAAPPPDFTPLLEYPLEPLKRAMSGRRFGQLLARLQGEGLPPVEEGSIVTVQLPWEPAAVKLLVPVEHSTCTCHSRELCAHKAQAILCYQLFKGKLSLKALLAQEDEEGGWEPEALRGVAEAVCAGAAAQLQTGVSRMPASVCDSLERLAALCHNARLPELEKDLRAAASVYRRYFARSAAYHDADLLALLAAIYRRAEKLQTAPENQLSQLAGTFREDYLPCPSLRLSLLGEREFHANSGFEGHIYYFWERTQRQFYTYTVARPTIYDSPRRGRPGQYQAAPWQLEGTMAHLYGQELELRGGRAARGRRLSSSGQSRAVLLGPLSPWDALPQERQYQDFSLLFRDLRPALPDGPEADRVALLLPRECDPPDFDRVQQAFRLTLRDVRGRSLRLEVKYRKEEERVVDTLERFAESLKQTGGRPAFLGICYLEGEELKLYPIEIYRDWGESL